MYTIQLLHIIIRKITNRINHQLLQLTCVGSHLHTNTDHLFLLMNYIHNTPHSAYQLVLRFLSFPLGCQILLSSMIG